ncbi:MAG TPA: response regulator [Candidatus Sulfotelmatobacter sp.]|nr:response regulator [Candidatus Sulfotelmatobacter sp.]
MKSGLRLLLVDDNPADVGLTREALARSPYHSQMESVEDGAEALAFLNRRGRYANAMCPDLVILDLSLPKRDGLAVLAAIRAGPELRRIPVVIFSTSQLGKDIARSYELGANCYVSKPGNLNDFLSAVKSIEEFWCDFASLPPRGE